MSHAYATTNVLSGLSASSFTWSNSYTGTDRANVCDGRLDKRVNIGSPTTSVNVVIDLGSAQTLSGFAFLNTNLVPTLGTVFVDIYGATNAGITTGVAHAKNASTLASYFSNSASEPRNKDHALAFTGISKRYWQIIFTFTGTLTNFSIGEIFAWSSATTLSRKSVYGSGEGEGRLTTQVQTLSGDVRSSFIAGPVRRKRLAWADFTSSERDELWKLHRAAQGGVTPVLWMESYVETSSAAASADQDCIYGRLASPDFDFQENDYRLYAPPEMVITSLGREVGS